MSQICVARSLSISRRRVGCSQILRHRYNEPWQQIHLPSQNKLHRVNYGFRYISTTSIVKDVSVHDAVQSAFKDPYLSQTPCRSPALAAVEHGLPQSCPGCGALTQDHDVSLAGFYSVTRRAVRKYLQRRKIPRVDAVGIVSDASVRSSGVDISHSSEHASTGTSEAKDDHFMVTDRQTREDTTSIEQKTIAADIPYCDRCHAIVHDRRGQSIIHPTIDDIADSIAESPFKRNHVYLVLDAADFPMSLVPGFFTKLELAKPRSQNRRSQHDFSSKPTLSFIITRSDLLGSTKEMVDSMMHYFQTVLRDALGKRAKDIRMGNIHLVSAKRGWWTQEIKDEIWKRGGGNWMVGKVNVGKSNLFEVLFPKGSGQRAPVYAELEQERSNIYKDNHFVASQNDDGLLDETRLLPPPQPESPFPVMPVVSSLPGTTASPIRLPFGRNRGELIDLPGLARGDLEKYVKPGRQLDLIMEHREKVEQLKIRPGQCLEIGNGLVTIVPQFDVTDTSMTYLACCFVPLKVHVTSTAKARVFRADGKEFPKSIVSNEMLQCMSSAGHFNLDDDVTKSKAGALIAAGRSLSSLPFRVYATDILLEGIGWIELVAQVRRARHSPVMADPAVQDQLATNTFSAFNAISVSSVASAKEPAQDEGPPRIVADGFALPRVHITSPSGKHIGQRKSLQAWDKWNSGRGGNTRTSQSSQRQKGLGKARKW